MLPGSRGPDPPNLPDPARPAPAWELRLAVGPLRPFRRRQQHPPRPVDIYPEHVTENQRPQHRGKLLRRHVFHPHRDQAAECRRPLFRGIPGPLEIRLRKQRYHPVRTIQRVAHRRHEILAWRPVPHIQLNGVPGRVQLPGHPLRPRPVSTGMTDEEINPTPTHTPSIPAITVDPEDTQDYRHRTVGCRHPLTGIRRNK